MRRNPNDVVQVKLRIRESERLLLVAAAERNMTTLNGEIGSRIRQREMLDAWRLAQDVGRCLAPLIDNAHELAKSGDLIRAADDMAALLASNSSDQDAITAAIARYGKVKRMIEIDAGIRIRAMHTTGAQP
jgi:hypothetical protein